MKIKWAAPALLDLSNIQEYIKRDSEYYAFHFIERIIEVVERLEKFPYGSQWNTLFLKDGHMMMKL